MTLHLYHNNMSVCAQKVRIVLAEKGLNAKETHLNLRAGDQQDPGYMKLNPKSYVPTLVNENDVVIESNVICAYLDEVFQEPPLMPSDPLGRAKARIWMRQTDERIHTACVVLSNTIAFRHQWLARPEEELRETIRKTPDFEIRERRRDIIENGTSSVRFKSAAMAYSSLAKEMDEALATSHWLAGDEITLADIALYPYINRVAELQLSFFWEHLPNLARWYDESSNRASIVQAIKQYDDPDYLKLMKSTGQDHVDVVRSTIASE